MPRRKSSTSFGQPNANPSGPGRQTLPSVPYVAPPDDGAPQLLQECRQVHLNDASHDRTHGQRMARQFLNGDIGKFGLALARMEKDLRETAKGAKRDDGPADKKPAKDLGTERALALVDKLLE